MIRDPFEYRYFHPLTEQPQVQTGVDIFSAWLEAHGRSSQPVAYPAPMDTLPIEIVGVPVVHDLVHGSN